MIASRPSPPASCGGGFAGVPSSPQSPAASARFARACLHPRSLRQRCHAPLEFERDGEVIKVDDSGPLNVRIGVTTDLAVAAAVAGTGVVIQLFETWLQPYFGSAGPFLYYPSRRYLPAPLRAYVSQLHRSRSGLLGLARASSWAPHCGGCSAARFKAGSSAFRHAHPPPSCTRQPEVVGRRDWASLMYRRGGSPIARLKAALNELSDS